MDIVKIINLEDKDGRIEWNVCWANALQAYGPEEVQQEDPEAWREEYRAKQAAGVEFEWYSELCKAWLNKKENGGEFDFREDAKERFREVPSGQLASALDKDKEQWVKEIVPENHHAAERALYWKQRAEGTNEVWQVRKRGRDAYEDIHGGIEPKWYAENEYRPKPKTRTVYFAFYRALVDKKVYVMTGNSSEDVKRSIINCSATQISEVESREVEVG